MDRHQDNVTGQIHTRCMMFKCENKAFGKYAGIVFCRKHLKKDFIKYYGSVKKASKYCEVYTLKD